MKTIRPPPRSTNPARALASEAEQVGHVRQDHGGCFREVGQAGSEVDEVDRPGIERATSHKSHPLEREPEGGVEEVRLGFEGSIAPGSPSTSKTRAAGSHREGQVASIVERQVVAGPSLRHILARFASSSSGSLNSTVIEASPSRSIVRSRSIESSSPSDSRCKPDRDLFDG